MYFFSVVFIYGAFHRVSFLYKNLFFFSIFQPERFEVPWVFDALPGMGVTRLEAETCKPWKILVVTTDKDDNPMYTSKKLGKIIDTAAKLVL